MLTIAIVGQKGGIAKTSTCAALGLGLHRAGKRVLYVDTDVQHNLSDILTDSNSAFTLADVLAERCTLTKAVIDTPQGGLVCASAALINQRKDAQKVLRDALQTVKRKYDVCLIDTPPAIGGLTDAAMVAADAVILPVKPDQFSLYSLMEISGNINRINGNIYRDKPLEVLGILPVMYNARATANRYTLEAITDQAREWGYPVLPPIRRSVAVEEMQFGNDLYTSKSGAASDYMQTVEIIMKKL